jgi:hypothetical protein
MFPGAALTMRCFAAWFMTLLRNIREASDLWLFGAETPGLTGLSLSVRDPSQGGLALARFRIGVLASHRLLVTTGFTGCEVGVLAFIALVFGVFVLFFVLVVPGGPLRGPPLDFGL